MSAQRPCEKAVASGTPALLSLQVVLLCRRDTHIHLCESRGADFRFWWLLYQIIKTKGLKPESYV